MTNSVNSDNNIHCWNSQPTEANFCKTQVANSIFKNLKSFIITHNLPVTICARVSCAVWLCWCCLFRFKPHLSKVDWSLEFWYYGTCYTNARTTHVYTHARMHTHTHTHTRTCTYTHAHTHTHACTTYPSEHWWTSQDSTLSILGRLGPHKSTSSKPTCQNEIISPPAPITCLPLQDMLRHWNVYWICTLVESTLNVIVHKWD